ncbi:MAG: outer-membrane lipoprotein carrier protein LolA [Endomicrobiaceae bacterium]|nr:outer-membrane lipoprotein carrier protein LolA [Endomicrobiaceae bacterium]
MKKIFFAFLIGIFSVGVVFSQDDGKIVTDIIKSMNEKESTIVDMGVEYSQSITYFSTGEKQSSRGEVKMKGENIYMYQRLPKRQYTYIDGKKIITYVPENKQAVVDNWKDILENDIVLATALNFSKNYKRFKRDYMVSLILQTDKEYCLIVKSVNINDDWKLYLNVDVKTFLVNSSIFENSNFKVEVKLLNYKLNTGLSDSIFQFNMPKDVELVEL